MDEKSNRNELIWILLVYLTPILAWIFYTYQNAPLPFVFSVASLGFVILFFGSALLFSLIKRVPHVAIEAVMPVLEKDVSEPIPYVPERIESEPIEKEMPNPLLEEMNVIKRKLDDKHLSLQEKEKENQEMKNKLHETLETHAIHEEEMRRKIENLESELHQKVQTSTLLENQIHDLRYEIKTLLQLTEVDYSHKEASTSYEKEEETVEPSLSVQPILSGSGKSLLIRCVDIAQKMTAGYHASSLRNLSLDPYAFDLRRFSDALRQETGALIVLYSPKDERILFANSETKKLLGLSPEQFSQDFSDYAGSSFAAWKNGVLQLLTKSEVTLTIEFKTKGNQEVQLKTLLASIPTGVFRSLVIGVLQPIE